MLKTARLFTTALMLAAAPAWAEEYKPDDMVTFNLAAEGWVTTTTARVTVNVDAAMTGAAAGNMRGEMQKAVNGLAKAEWRLISFSRSQDSSGLERWNASFEARVPESDLAGIHDTAKKASKAGMQLTVNDIAFDPTLAETETVKAKLRTDLYKQANEQLAALNAAIPGRQYRISALTFGAPGSFVPPMAPRPMMMKAAAMGGAEGMAVASDSSMARAEKITQDVQVIFSAVAPVAAK